MYFAVDMVKDTTLYIPKDVSEDVRQLLVKERDAIANLLGERESELLPYKLKLRLLNQMIDSFYDAPPEINEGDEYSHKWRIPLKTMYILKHILKRPASANEVIAAIELKDNGMTETKKTTVFSALSNQAESGQLVKTKPGNENLFCHADYANRGETTIQNQLNMMK